jgi:hypothetical protein
MKSIKLALPIIVLLIGEYISASAPSTLKHGKVRILKRGENLRKKFALMIQLQSTALFLTTVI